MQRHPYHGQPFPMHNHVVTGPRSQQQSQQQQQAPKALRFVTNYGAPHPKRRRIGAACLTCRKRKTACSGERPFCDTCKQNKLECAGYSSELPSQTSSKRRTPEPTAAKTGDRGDVDGENVSAKRRHPSPSWASAKQPPRVKDAPKPPVAGNQSPRPMPAPKPLSKAAETSPRGSLFSGPRNRMPYFRWLGPTAIMPGFKQMVVKVKRQDTSDRGRSSTNGDSIRSPSINNLSTSDARASTNHGTTSSANETDLRPPLDLPFYDTSSMPPSELITHLAQTFFTHLGCNYPFLQREGFLRDLEEKKVDAILVDAVCALSARFSTHELLTQFANDAESKAGPAEYGHAFAQRAKNSLIDTFPCPTVAAAQAALLLAYNEFGEQKDSGLWMYLGIAIRLAQDLGMHKLEGLKYIGRSGPTPKSVKRQSQRRDSNDSVTRQSGTATDNAASPPTAASTEPATEKATDSDEQIAVEQERVDTFWAIFFLDRVVSSGTGRRSTLRDKDIELSFPSEPNYAKDSRWPAPFPALIRIVHLYGLVADLLNSIKEPSEVDPETPKRLANMERQVTDFYQGLSSRLHFDAVNFQHYMRAGEGTNFVLLHFWFHTLIILLHQPTLLQTFEGPMLRLFPNSQQLAMSSAKTIADILSYSQLMDAKASLGNPFTSQPIYIAACAFLKETAEQTASSSAHSCATSPGRERDGMAESTASVTATPLQPIRKASIAGVGSTHTASPSTKRMSIADVKGPLSKHTLLATAASQHYQLCYKALQSLETYWAGTKYILTVLDQKFAGVGDPLLYTTEEGESSMEEPKPEPSFTSPGWRRQHSWGPPIVSTSIENMPSPFWRAKGLNQVPESPHGVDPSKAIGWTLTGTMDSPSTHLAWHYSSGSQSGPNIDPRLSSISHDDLNGTTSSAQNPPHPNQLDTNSANAHHLNSSADLARSNMSTFPIPPVGTAVNTNGGPMAMGVAYASNSDPNGMTLQYHHQHPQHLPSRPFDHSRDPTNTINAASSSMDEPYNASSIAYMPGQGLSQMNFFPGDMMIESQDVDMSMLGLDMMPWFDSYPPHDMMGLFDTGHNDPGVAGNGSATRPE